MNEMNGTPYNKRLALRALNAPSGFRKTPVGLRPLWYFAAPHFAGPGLASQALIRAGKTSPTLNVKRQKSGRKNKSLHLPDIFNFKECRNFSAFVTNTGVI